MTERDDSSGLRAVRLAHGWSQSEAARELTALARARGSPVASTGSLKTLLSRWENGHSTPDPPYRALLADLYDRTPTELGIGSTDEPAGSPTDGLVASLASAATGQRDGIRLWRRQLELAHALAGTQALDRIHHDRAWRRFEQARTAALVAERPAAGAGAVAGQAAVLVDVGQPDTAVDLLGQIPPLPEGPAQARLHAALAVAAAAKGESRTSRRALAAAERGLRRSTPDLLDHVARPAVELADLHRWQGRVLVTLGDEGALEPLQQALDGEPRSARHRAAVHADLALTLQAERPRDAAAHARTARQLATGIGSARIAARLSTLGSPR